MIKVPRSRTRLSSAGLILALAIVVLASAACGSSVAPPADATEAPAAATAPAATVSGPTAPAAETSEAPAAAATVALPDLDLPTGVTADGDFYRGDPAAPVSLVEFSDFQ